MTLHALTIPKWGLSMEEGTLSSWLVDDGAAIVPGMEVADIETSKITNALEAQSAGILRRASAEGELLPVGALIGVVSDAGEGEAEIDAFVESFKAHAAANEEKAEAVAEPEIVSVAGRPIRYLRVAATREPAGLPVVLIHGYGGDHLNWLFNQSALADARDVYALDLPGHGGSSKDVGDATFDTLADGVVAWMDALSLGEVHLVGHSMGAGVALVLAARHVDRVRSIVAINGAGFGGTLNRDYVEGFLAAEKRKDLKPVVALLFADEALATRTMIDDLIAYKRIDGVAPALRALIDNALSVDSLAALERQRATVAAAVFTITGTADQVVRGAPDAAGQDGWVAEGAGHMPQLEAAPKVNDQIAQFLARND